MPSDRFSTSISDDDYGVVSWCDFGTLFRWAVKPSNSESNEIRRNFITRRYHSTPLPKICHSCFSAFWTKVMKSLLLETDARLYIWFLSTFWHTTPFLRYFGVILFGIHLYSSLLSTSSPFVVGQLVDACPLSVFMLLNKIPSSPEIMFHRCKQGRSDSMLAKFSSWVLSPSLRKTDEEGDDDEP